MVGLVEASVKLDGNPLGGGGKVASPTYPGLENPKEVTIWFNPLQLPIGQSRTATLIRQASSNNTFHEGQPPRALPHSNQQSLWHTGWGWSRRGTSPPATSQGARGGRGPNCDMGILSCPPISMGGAAALVQPYVNMNSVKAIMLASVESYVNMNSDTAIMLASIESYVNAAPSRCNANLRRH